MKKKKRVTKINAAYFAAVAFLAAYLFFQFGYPYHLMRREQMSMFVYDGDYIAQTYRGVGWLAKFICDFLEQFFCLSVVGPVVVAALLTGIGFFAYKSARNFLGKGASLAVAAPFYLWSFVRETENIYSTRYTIVVLGFLALLFAALRFRKVWMKAAAAVLLLGFGVWALGSPYHRYYGRLWGKPELTLEKVIALDTEVSREHWDKVLRMSKKDLRISEASYCYNLAHAMKGDLPLALMKRAQNYANSLLYWSTVSHSPFNVGVVGEAWYQLGDMTLAEQSTIITLISMPNHVGTRPVMRLARCNMVTGDEGAAQKYLDLLARTLFYGRWARRVLAGNPDEATARWLEETRKKLPSMDRVYVENDFRPVLLGLLDADPTNSMARDYLLCYDLLLFDLDHFVEDYSEAGMPDVPIYKEAILIWLSQQDRLTEATAAQYGVDTSTMNRMQRFFRNPDGYKSTYWYYYLQALE